ncbi:MAG TPA: succinyldiaminopimelate transaminase [Vicinamibacterales bacterium]|nr:succinyldiaminopimelate transaminase [Vicinamibacterales bacterium]
MAPPWFVAVKYDVINSVNSRLSQLQPYPFEKLRALLSGLTPARRPIPLSIGEPQHTTPDLIRCAITGHLDGLSFYPSTAGSDRLHDAIASWFVRRYRLKSLDARAQVLPVNGTREALFAFGQAVIDSSRATPAVVCPNPFYQIYEGAAVLAGAEPLFLNQTAGNGFALDLDSLSTQQWARTRLLYVCSPANPSGRVLTLHDWRALFDHSDRYGFVIASDECYSEIYDARPPLGALEAAQELGRDGFSNLVVFNSLSKRSNAPGLRAGAVAGDATLLKQFLLYRTYHGSAMSLVVQHASIAAWNDEAHVEENRRQYREKFDALVPMLQPVLDAPRPEAGFYLWARVPGGDDERFAKALFASTHVTVLPGQYLARDAHGTNPGRGYVRMALVPALADCVEAARRIVAFCG